MLFLAREGSQKPIVDIKRIVTSFSALFCCCRVDFAECKMTVKDSEVGGKKYIIPSHVYFQVPLVAHASKDCVITCSDCEHEREVTTVLMW